MSRATKILLAVGLVAAATAGYWYVALAPKRDQIAQLDTKVASKQAEVQQTETTAQSYEATRAAYRRNYATVVRLGKAVPAADDVRSLVVQLDASAKRSKIDFSDITLNSVGSSASATASADTTSSFVKLPFKFSFAGSFFRLSDFLSQLDHFVRVDGNNVDVTGRLLHIDSFSLSPQGDDASQLTAEIGATSYELPRSDDAAAGATAQGPAATPTPAGGTTTSSTTTATAGVTG